MLIYFRGTSRAVGTVPTPHPNPDVEFPGVSMRAFTYNCDLAVLKQRWKACILVMCTVG